MDKKQKILVFIAFYKLLKLIFKDTLNAFEDFKNKQQKCTKCFFDMSKHVYPESVFNTL